LPLKVIQTRRRKSDGFVFLERVSRKGAKVRKGRKGISHATAQRRKEKEIGRRPACRQAGYYDDYDLLRFFRLEL
jgi:hypothetical protein